MKSKPGPKPIQPADNFADAYRAFDVGLLDDRGLFDAYYVSRPDSPVEEMKNRLLVATEKCHTLYLGTRRSGKTTELGRLEHEVEDRFFVVFISVLKDMEPSDIKPIDLLLFSAVKLCSKAIEAGVKVGKDMEKDIAEWLLQNTNEVFRTRIAEKSGKVTLAAKLKAVLAELGGSYSLDATLRTEVRQRLGPRVAEVAERIELLAARVMQSLAKEPLIIIDDLEKIDLADQVEMFANHAATLTRPRCRTIYTADRALVYLPSWNVIRASFPLSIEVLSLRTSRRDGNPYPPGRELLKRLILRRVKAELFEPDALGMLTTICNGVIGDLTEAAQYCCISALAEKAPKITWHMVDRKYLSLSDNFRRMINETEYDRLAGICQTHEAKKDAGLSDLLFMHAVIEYRDEAGLYYDVHPAVVPILKQKRLIPA